MHALICDTFEKQLIETIASTTTINRKMRNVTTIASCVMKCNNITKVVAMMMILSCSAATRQTVAAGATTTIPKWLSSNNYYCAFANHNPGGQKIKHQRKERLQQRPSLSLSSSSPNSFDSFLWPLSSSESSVRFNNYYRIDRSTRTVPSGDRRRLVVASSPSSSLSSFSSLSSLSVNTSNEDKPTTTPEKDGKQKVPILVNLGQSIRNQLRAITGFSLTSFRTTVRTITGISLSTLYATSIACTNLYIRQCMKYVLQSIPPSFRYFFQPFLILYYVPFYIIKTLCNPKNSTTNSNQQQQKQHESFVTAWKHAIQIADETTSYWPIHVNDSTGEIYTDDAEEFEDINNAISDSIELCYQKENNTLQNLTTPGTLSAPTDNNQ